MGIRALIFCLLLFSSQVEASVSGRILFLMQAGKTHDAIKLYRESYGNRHDFDLLQQMGLTLLDQGYRSGKPEEQLITLLGAGISGNERASYIMEGLAENSNPQLQLISLQLLARYQNEDTNIALTRAMRSDNLLIRLEAAHMMAQTKHPKALGQLEALMYKVDPALHFVFPQLFALEGSPAAIRVLHRLLGHPKEDVRIAAVLSAVQFNRDDLLGKIRKMASHHGPGQQEACAYALGALHDQDSEEKLRTLAASETPGVKVAALLGLYRLGRNDASEALQSLAKKENLLAIIALGDVEGSQATLASLASHPSLIIRMHAGLSLIQLRDSRGLPLLYDVFFPDKRDLAFIRGSSAGKAFTAWKVMPGASNQASQTPFAYELSLEMREKALVASLELPEEDFLGLADEILKQRQNDLVPALVQLLENLHSPAATALLRKYQQQAGAPLVRHYCALALYRMKEEGPWADILRTWVLSEQNREMIQLRPYIPIEMRDPVSKYEITAREMPRLLIETFESFAASQDEQAVDVLLEAIQHGNSQNQYALAGLLIRTVQ